MRSHCCINDLAICLPLHGGAFATRGSVSEESIAATRRIRRPGEIPPAPVDSDLVETRWRRIMSLPANVVLTAASIFALSATAAPAAIVCNDEGECWHVRG